MDTHQIYAALKTKKSTKDCFNSIYPIDKLPLKNSVRYNKNGECFLVINLDPSWKNGSHWIAICISPSEYLADEYFDSYGLEPPRKIKNYLDGHYIFHRKKLQSIESTICGQWCIYYIWKRCQGWDFWEIVNSFKTSSPEKNDEKINKLINSNFPCEKQPLLDFSMLDLQNAVSLSKNNALRLREKTSK